jgi:molybdopterin-guanine dinucleotide biosynthesis protein
MQLLQRIGQKPTPNSPVDKFLGATWRQVRRVLNESWPCDVLAPVYAPRVLALRILPHRMSDVARIEGAAGRLEIALAASPVSVRRQAGRLFVEVPVPPEFQWTPWADRLPPATWPEVPIGVTTLAKPFAWDFHRHPHMIVTGASGTGKTTLVGTIISKLYGAGRTILACDHKPDRMTAMMAPLDRARHAAFIQTAGEAANCLQWLRDTLEERAAGDQEIFLILDDVPALLRAEPRASEVLGTLASISRSAGIHVIICAQETSVNGIGETLVGRNIPDRIVMRVDSGATAARAAGRADVPAHLLCGMGDALAVTSEGVTRIQVAMSTPLTVRNAVEGAGGYLASARLSWPWSDIEPEQAAAPIDPIPALADRARETWQRLRSADGTMPRGAMTAIVEAVYGKREVGGYRDNALKIWEYLEDNRREEHG